MSGFRFQKVTSGAQIVSAVKVGTLHGSRGHLSGRERRWRDSEILKCTSLVAPRGGCYGSWLFSGELQDTDHLPVLVSTMIALAQHLKEASTAPMAIVSVGSRVRWVMRRSSSNICLWNMAASASRAIWARQNTKPRASGCGRTVCFKMELVWLLNGQNRGRCKSSYLSSAHCDKMLTSSRGHDVQALLLSTTDPQTHANWAAWSHS